MAPLKPAVGLAWNADHGAVSSIAGSGARMSEVSLLPERGQIVRVRSRRYLVEDLTPAPDPRDSSLIRLACVDDDAQGQTLELLWDHEPDAEVLSAESWK